MEEAVELELVEVCDVDDSEVVLVILDKEEVVEEMDVEEEIVERLEVLVVGIEDEAGGGSGIN